MKKILGYKKTNKFREKNLQCNGNHLASDLKNVQSNNLDKCLCSELKKSLAIMVK